MRRATVTFELYNSLCQNFYPRSPCGERPAADISARRGASISIHALLAESDAGLNIRQIQKIEFLSTLSLRRATRLVCRDRKRHPDFYPRSPCGERQEFLRVVKPSYNFYPRSPCGERPDQTILKVYGYGISIHALLAESDLPTDGLFFFGRRFLSTLSLRRATKLLFGSAHPGCISIHALLAESDGTKKFKTPVPAYFYPRSPCGERRF